MVKKNNQIIIAGPCSIEKKEQLYNLVEKIHHNIDVLRAGVWKARTSPNDYPGIGELGLPWLKDIQQKYKTPVAIEVGTVKHIELALKHSIKIFWLGARTTANPFAVQELAESMKSLDIELWIKNPIISDLRLWVGTVERIKKIGINNIKIIHRGFYSDKKLNYRNAPNWELLQKFKNYFPELPILCDPSHIAGQKRYIYEIATRAYFEKPDGLMIEVHNEPHRALSDKLQQLDPQEFKNLLIKLNYPS